ncbi:GTP-binding protein Obg [Nonlabens ulvanivorans]|uniref:GTP-binding protein Obg n=1 Tax=Nonlabens ulvanivorans TaxID=906888 RepID=A0A081D8V8_NONUL|nr:GTP-binding protein Obg [Nonlabens ulvanivorans]
MKKYNPELLDKNRFVCISKADMLDEELMEQMKEGLDEEGAFDGAPYMFISSLSQFHMQELKDRLWQMLNE